MKNKVLLSLAFFVVTSSSAFSSQTFCKTLDGRNIVLESNGTWRYTDAKVAKKSVNAKRFAKSKKNSLGVWFDDNLWTQKNTQANEDSEFTFSMNNGAGYVIMINESVGLSDRFMRKAVIERLENVLENTRVVCEEDRIVNGLNIKYFEIHGSYEDTNVVYMFYVYNGENETTQLIAYTISHKFPQLKNKFEDFLNGLAR